GFRDESLARLAVAGVAPPLPSATPGLRLVRTGRFARTGSRPFDHSVAAYAQGLSWLTVTRVSGWERPALFGVGQFAQRVRLGDVGVGYYEPATDTEPRRVAVHTADGEVLVSTNLDRATLLEVAATLAIHG